MKPNQSSSPLRWVPSVYFAMGLPFVVLNMVAVLMFRGLNVSDAQIALWTSAIMLPWTLKPLWSPFLEMFKTKKFFVVLTQITTGVLFGLVALSLNMPHPFAIAVALLGLIAFSGATHDIVTDGIYMKELDSATQAKYCGWQGAFYNLAKVLATGGFVFLAGVLITHFTGNVDGMDEVQRAAAEYRGNVYGWGVIMLMCGGLMVALGFYHSRYLPTGGSAQHEVRTAGEMMRETWSIILAFFEKKFVLWYIAFIVLYRFAEGFVIKIVPLFLKAPVANQGLGLSEQEIGIYYGGFGAAAFILGSILSGYYTSHFGLKKVLFSLCCAFNIPFAVYALLAIYQPTSPLFIAGGIIFEYFGYGFGFVGLTLYIMQQIAPGKHQMAHYAFASGLANLGVMLPGMVSGYISDWLGYREFFIFILIATVPAFLVAWFAPFRDVTKEE